MTGMPRFPMIIPFPDPRSPIPDSHMPATCLDPVFGTLLDRYGPEQAGRVVSLEDAERHCRAMASGHYENFPVLSVVLPKTLRQDFANVYAYCRWADDLGDEIEDPRESLELLDWWRRELDDCFAGRAWHPVFVALRETIVRRGLDQRPFDDLLSAFRQDQTKTSYETYEELRDYCRRSADPVGRIVLQLCERDTPENIAKSDSVCTGLQLINFWQDIARDFERGRVYLPREDRERFGYSDADLQSRCTTDAFRELLRFEVDRARAMLSEGMPLADCLSGRLKVVIAMFAMGGLRICERIDEIDYRVWERRPTLTASDASRILARASARAVGFPFRRGRA